MQARASGGALHPHLVLGVARDGEAGDLGVGAGGGRDGGEERVDVGEVLFLFEGVVDQVGPGVMEGDRRVEGVHLDKGLWRWSVEKTSEQGAGKGWVVESDLMRYLRGRGRAHLPPHAVVGVGGDGREAEQLVHRQEVVGTQPVALEGTQIRPVTAAANGCLPLLTPSSPRRYFTTGEAMFRWGVELIKKFK